MAYIDEPSPTTPITVPVGIPHPQTDRAGNAEAQAPVAAGHEPARGADGDAPCRCSGWLDGVSSTITARRGQALAEGRRTRDLAVERLAGGRRRLAPAGGPAAPEARCHARRPARAVHAQGTATGATNGQLAEAAVGVGRVVAEHGDTGALGDHRSRVLEQVQPEGVGADGDDQVVGASASRICLRRHGRCPANSAWSWGKPARRVKDSCPGPGNAARSASAMTASQASHPSAHRPDDQGRRYRSVDHLGQFADLGRRYPRARTMRSGDPAASSSAGSSQSLIGTTTSAGPPADWASW